MSNIGHTAVVALLLFYMGPAAADANCAGQARNPMEKTYCQVLAAGAGSSLPPLREFRKNPEKTQRLLLRRPAERAGVSLPAPSVARAVAPAPAEPESDQGNQPLGSSLRSLCKLEPEVVVCAQQQYHLLANRANNQLPESALSAANRLQLSDYAGSYTDTSALLTYLDDSYTRYIHAMISIGLAASTMSFTKFYHTYNEVQKNSGDFAERMAVMFEYLKKDKQTIAVAAHPNERRPLDLDLCRKLDHRTIVCDDVKNNWVYRR